MIEHIRYPLITLAVLGLFCLPLVFDVQDFYLRFQPSMVDVNRQALNKLEPEVLFVGNSMVYDNIDLETFRDNVSSKTFTITSAGARPSFWYLVLKNLVITIQNKPKLVIIPFRDAEWMETKIARFGRYKKSLDIMSKHNEPLLKKLTYNESPLGIVSGILTFRQENIHYDIEGYLYNYVVNELLDDVAEVKQCAYPNGCERPRTISGQIRRVIYCTFSPKDNYRYSDECAGFERPDAVDFNQAVENSYLPEIIKIAQENNIILLLVRMKAAEDLVPNTQPPSLKKYIKDFSEYLEANKIAFIDFSDEAALTKYHYKDINAHLTQEGSKLLTHLLAERIKEQKLLDR